MGNIVGKTLLPGETNKDLYNKFVAIYEGDTKLEDWETFAQPIVGKDWETIKKEVAENLGLTGEPATEPVTEEETAAPTNAPTNAPSTVVSGKVVNTSDRNVVVGLSVVLMTALSVAFVMKRKKEN